VHDPEFCSLDGVVGVKGVRNPMLTVVVSTSGYLDFIPYAVTLACFCTIGLDWRRLSSCIVSWGWRGVPWMLAALAVLLTAFPATLAGALSGH
jgi:hypothetical protein